MKHSFRRILLAVLGASFMLALSLFVTACGEKSNYTLSFVTGDGVVAISPIQAEGGATISLPQNPQKEGYVFAGWYDNAEFSGSPVELPTVMPEQNVTYYAKFNKAPMGKLTLSAGEGGTLSQTQYEINVGTNVSQFLEDKAPQTVGNATFDGWYIGSSNTVLSKTTTMTKNGLTLTAKYKVGYSVKVYLQNENDDEYTFNGELSYEATERLGDEVEANDVEVTVENYFALNEELSTEELELGTVSADNVLNVYYDWKTVTVQFRANAPTVKNEAGKDVTASFEGEVANLTVRATKSFTLPENGYEIDGFRFAGWSKSTTSTDLTQPDGTMASGTNFTLYVYARWNRGAVDLNGGTDLIFRLMEQPNTVVLQRTGLEEKFGTYEESTGKFSFNVNDSTKLTGIVFEDESFVYYLEKMAKTFTQDDWMGTGTQAVTLRLDGLTGAVYGVEGKEISGSYLYSPENGCFEFRANDAKELDPFYFEMSENNQFRKRDENTTHICYSFYEEEGKLSYPIITLDGFGNAKYQEEVDGEVTVTTYSVLRTYEDSVTLNDASVPIIKSVISVSPESSGVFATEYQIRFVPTTDGDVVAVYEEASSQKETIAFYSGSNTRISFTMNGYQNADYTISRSGKADSTGVIVYVKEGTYEDGTTTWNYLSFMLEGALYTVRYDANNSAIANQVGNEVGIYDQALSKTNYYIRVQLVSSNESGNGTALMSVRLVNGGYRVVATGSYLKTEEKDVFTFGGLTYEKDFESLSSYFSNQSFKLHTSSSVFTMQDKIRKTYTFQMNGEEYKLECKDFGVGKVNSKTETTDVVYVLSEGYTYEGTEYIFIMFRWNNYTRVLRAPVSGESKVDAFFVSAPLPNVVCHDYGNRLEGDQVLQLFYDGHAIIFEADANGEYTKLVCEGQVENTDNGYVFTATTKDVDKKYNQFTFKGKSHNSWDYFGVYNATEEDLSVDGVSLNGFGIAYVFNVEYRYEIVGNKLNLYVIGEEGTVPVRTLDIQNGKVVRPQIVFGKYYGFVTNTAGTLYYTKYMLELDGNGIATLIDAESGDELIKGTYMSIPDAENRITLTFGGEYADQSGTVLIHGAVGSNGALIPGYLYGNESNEMTYTFEDGAILTVDELNLVEYVDGEGNKLSVLYYLLDTTALDGKKIVLLAVDGVNGKLSRYGYYLVTNESQKDKMANLVAMNLGFGTYYRYENDKAQEGYIVLDGLSVAVLNENGTQKTGIYVAGKKDAEYVITWTDGTTSSVLLQQIKEEGEYVNVFIEHSGEEDKSYNGTKWEALTLDGYGYATYVDANGETVTVRYEYLPTKGLIRLYGEAYNDVFNVSFTEVYLLLDEENGTFSVTEKPNEN